uniref:Uncharacterized protein n=1 Tax=Arundo donax TaxID=35708 RepID=A0A0A9FVY3_ARUDO
MCILMIQKTLFWSHISTKYFRVYI